MLPGNKSSPGWYFVASTFVCRMLNMNLTALHECGTVGATGVSSWPNRLQTHCNLETRQDNHLDINMYRQQHQLNPEPNPSTSSREESVCWERIHDTQNRYHTGATQQLNFLNSWFVLTTSGPCPPPIQLLYRGGYWRGGAFSRLLLTEYFNLYNQCISN